MRRSGRFQRYSENGKLGKVDPEFVVSDLDASLPLWFELIGFSVAYDRPEAGFAYQDLDGAQVMLKQRNTADDQ
ncbi:hypothetical protein SAMN02746095_02920 [Acidocella aminolytica 101 = DSM 11237]|nr:hypothetical protein AA11237_0205 [Acidocella aminolytica 101 = DSM 11237]SHF34585.1 hypothetical protein SAMN02746095_02920 [Acidocella aminolytica 101 = DSM 11237]